MRKTILLTGASGEIGYETFQELLVRKERYHIRVLSLDRKHERKIFEPFGEKIEVVWGDLRDAPTVRRAVEGVDSVLHVGGIIPPLADERPALARDVNVGGTRNVLAAILAHSPRPKLIFTSSIAVYGDRIKSPDIRVGDQVRASASDDYARTKIEAENLIRGAGIQWTIFRLSAILTDQLKFKPLMFHMPLETRLEWCHKADVGYALVEALGCEEVWGRVFNLGGGVACRVSARDFISRILTLYGISPNALPEYAFATQNFHCGNYVDGDELESLLGFRRHALGDYFQQVRQNIPAFQRFWMRLLPAWVVRGYFRRLSEPFKAIQENNLALIERFYGSRRKFEMMAAGHVAT